VGNGELPARAEDVELASKEEDAMVFFLRV
jgi:hypothetical protein